MSLWERAGRFGAGRDHDAAIDVCCLVHGRHADVIKLYRRKDRIRFFFILSSFPALALADRGLVCIESRRWVGLRRLWGSLIDQRSDVKVVVTVARRRRRRKRRIRDGIRQGDVVEVRLLWMIDLGMFVDVW
jgi:hypothetical protein